VVIGLRVVDGDGAVGLADGDGNARIVVDVDACGGGVVDGVDVVGGGAVADEDHGEGWMGRLVLRLGCVDGSKGCCCGG